MDDSDDFDDVFFNSVSEYGKAVFDDFLNPVNRDRQVKLILSAVFTFLFTYTVVEPTDFSPFGFKLIFAHPEYIPIGAAIICIYYLVAYTIGAWQDWQHLKYKALPISIKKDELLAKIAIDQHKQLHHKIGIVGELAENLQKNVDLRSTINEKMSELDAKHRAENEEANKKDIFASLYLYPKQQKEKEGLLKQYTEVGKDKYTTELFEQAEISEKRSKILRNKADILIKAGNQYMFFSSINLVWEIAFPILFSVTAISLAILEYFKII